MLTFYYDDYRVHIHDTGRVDYVRLDDVTAMPAMPVVVTDPPAAVMAVAAAVIPLMMSDVMKADLRVERLRRDMRAATVALENAIVDRCKAEEAISDCTIEVGNVSFALKAAEESLQLAKAK